MATKKLPAVLHAEVVIIETFGYGPTGVAHYSQNRDISGQFQVVTRRHLYNWVLGIDIYPTPEQFQTLLEGKPLRGVRWA